MRNCGLICTQPYNDNIYGGAGRRWRRAMLPSKRTGGSNPDTHGMRRQRSDCEWPIIWSWRPATCRADGGVLLNALSGNCHNAMWSLMNKLYLYVTPITFASMWSAAFSDCLRVLIMFSFSYMAVLLALANSHWTLMPFSGFPPTWHSYYFGSVRL